MKKPVIALIAPLMLLSACAGGGGSSSEDVVSLQTLVARGQAYERAAEFDEDNGEPIPTAFTDLPTSGSVNYEGIATISEQRTVTTVEGGGAIITSESDTTYLAIGSATATVDFASTEFSIVGSDFYEIDLSSLDGDNPDVSDVSGTPVDGTLTIDMSRDVMGENSYRAQATGSITAVDGTVRTVDETGGGFFTGDNAAALFVEAFDDTEMEDLPDGTYIDESMSAGAGLVRR
ncbi:hypothetical protein [Yoonia sp. 2307UL14-13]|uniref:hypothetical protein n=1 Tax=Yoonia sp. 2307UL14-13 TaxID=3126506 RepID=UPI0030AE4C5B